MDVTLLYFDGCPSWQTTDQRLRELADEHGFDVTHRKVETPEAAEELSFRGSPTVLIDGRDPFAEGDEPVGCRAGSTRPPTDRPGHPRWTSSGRSSMPDDHTSRSVIAVVVAAAVCCGAAALLVSAGLLAAGGGLFGSPELTLVAAVAGLLGLWRLVVAIRRTRS